MNQTENAPIDRVILKIQSPKGQNTTLHLTRTMNRAGEEYSFYDSDHNVLTLKMENGHLDIRLALEQNL